RSSGMRHPCRYLMAWMSTHSRYARCWVNAGMPRHVVRSSSAALHRDRAMERFRRKGPTSALSGHVDYVDLAERVGQGVTVDDVTGVEPSKPRRRRPSGH